MKRTITFSIFLLVIFLASTLPLEAKVVNINTLLLRTSKPRLTSMQKLDIVESYKGVMFKGKGKVKDIIKSFKSKDKAMVQLVKTIRGQTYEIILIVDKKDVQKTKKGRWITFEGVFAGFNFDTIRFDNVKIISKKWWWSF